MATKKSPEKQKVFRLPVLPLRDTLLFPGTVVPILLGREGTLKAVVAAQGRDGLIFLSLQRRAEQENILPADLYSTGVIARIQTRGALPNGLSKVLLECLEVADAMQWFSDHSFLEVNCSPHRLRPTTEHNARMLAKDVLELFSDYANHTPDLPAELLQTLSPLAPSAALYHAMMPFIRTDVSVRQKVLESTELENLASAMRDLLQTHREVGVLSRQIDQEVRGKIQKSQKEYLLNEQLRLIQEELGDAASVRSPEVEAIEKQIRERELPEAVLNKLEEELKRLPLLHHTSPEYSVVRNYIDWVLGLPFGIYSRDMTSIARVRRVLNSHHYGIRDVKNRILEHVAVLQLSSHRETPILCLVGPPGTGKTTLGRSIAEALGRKFVRISLGGMRDEAEIRGHRRTYIGSMPGRIVQALKRCRTMNPVILLDEVDKLANDWRGDPSSALLELLDPEQNSSFTDNYLETGIDLSQVLFICTANVGEAIPEPLADRMEVIRLSGYYSHEKKHIAADYLLPKVCTRNGLEWKKTLVLDDGCLESIIREYTREAGVRALERELDKICRKRAAQIVSKKKFRPLVRCKELSDYLGVPRFDKQVIVDHKRPGVVTGLAWTPTGGAILQIECVLLSGKGRLKLTGTLGEVMKESAHIALTLVRERAKGYGIDPAVFQKTDIHIHFPEGSIPKDGPSAGIGLVVALLSSFTRKKVPNETAFTGEVSLTGQIHAIGGLPEKSIAALESGVKRIVVPSENGKNVNELPARVKKGIRFLQLKHIDEVLKKIFGVPNRNSKKKS